MPDMNRVILKKYSNRRLYDTEKSAYVTLNEVAEMIKLGRWVEVVDVDTGEDVTALTLTQIIMEAARRKNALLPVPLLHLIIRFGENLLSDFFEKYLEKIIGSYLSYKQIADEQFNKWLEMGAGLSDTAKQPFAEANPLQSFFAQFFTPKASDPEEKKTR